jgi:hypothetical protein
VADPFKTDRSPGAMLVAMDEEAAKFLATHGRLLDRRRFALLAGTGTAAEVLAALSGYRNADGGYGNGLEPDFRSVTSQPVAALHAFEVFEGIAPVTSPDAAGLCDWLASVTLPGGGLPFALPYPDPEGCAPFWSTPDPREPSLHMTALLAGIAHRVGRHDKAVLDHPWLDTATGFSMAGIRQLTGRGHALEFRYCLDFLDAVHDLVPDAPTELARLGRWLPASGVLPVEGGTEDVRPLDFAPAPDRPIRTFFSKETIDTELAGLAAARQDDGGWDVDWTAFSPAGALDWRGWATVRALILLRTNHR